MMKVPKSVKLAHCNNQKDTFEIVPIAHNIYISYNRLDHHK
jgi:hypothetical protein